MGNIKKALKMSSCDAAAIAFKRDELCFHVVTLLQKSFESGETSITSCKNCHNFLTERFLEKSVGGLIEVPMLLAVQKFR